MSLEHLAKPLTLKQLSNHKLKRNLYESLKKQREIANRIYTLEAQKQKTLKSIERKMQSYRVDQSLRHERALKKDQLEKSFEQQKSIHSKNNQLFSDARRELAQSIHFKQSSLRQTKHSKFTEIKRVHMNNQEKLKKAKEIQIQTKRQRRNQIKTMEGFGKENIKRYWDFKVQDINGQKLKEAEKTLKVLQKSAIDLNKLHEREKIKLQQLKDTKQAQQKFKMILKMKTVPSLDNESIIYAKFPKFK